jgi:hypothetical protein
MTPDDFGLPPTSELYNSRALVARHSHLLSLARVQWALRHRHTNGLGAAVFETKAGELYIHEPAFLAWFLGLTGRNKPRVTGRKRQRRRVSRR